MFYNSGYECWGLHKLIDVQMKSLLDSHNAIEAGIKGESTPLTGNITVSILNTVDCAGGMLSSPNEVGTLTLGEPYKTVRVEDDETVATCSMQNYNFSFNAMKLDELRSNSILSSFKAFIENPEYLME